MSKEEAIQKLRETQDSYLKDELDIAIGVVLQLIEQKENRIDKLEKMICLISEICIDVSKQHTNSEQGIKEIVKILEE